jgi:hypothetical protein
MAIPLRNITTGPSVASTVSVHSLPSPALSDETDNARDVERPPPSPLSPDPYQFRGAMKTEEQLEAIRRRGAKGKVLQAYYQRQNEVRCALNCLTSAVS